LTPGAPGVGFGFRFDADRPVLRLAVDLGTLLCV